MLEPKNSERVRSFLVLAQVTTGFLSSSDLAVGGHQRVRWRIPLARRPEVYQLQNVVRSVPSNKAELPLMLWRRDSARSLKQISDAGDT